MRLPDSARAAIEGGAHGHLVTLDADGSPQVTVVWAAVAESGEELLVASLGARRKLANVTRDPHVAISFEGSGKSGLGLLDYLVVRGPARIVEGGAPELLQRLAATYLGPGVQFPPMADPPPGYVMHIAIERVGGSGPWR